MTPDHYTHVLGLGACALDSILFHPLAHSPRSQIPVLCLHSAYTTSCVVSSLADHSLSAVFPGPKTMPGTHQGPPRMLLHNCVLALSSQSLWAGKRGEVTLALWKFSEEGQAPSSWSPQWDGTGTALTAASHALVYDSGSPSCREH